MEVRASQDESRPRPRLLASNRAELADSRRNLFGNHRFPGAAGVEVNTFTVPRDPRLTSQGLREASMGELAAQEAGRDSQVCQGLSDALLGPSATLASPSCCFRTLGWGQHSKVGAGVPAV